ncbi:MAG: hypothetical protein ACRDJ5_05445 [Actinomycetota bacterium]
MTTPPALRAHGSLSSLFRLALAALLTSALYGALFSYRTDYLGHYAAGLGGTLLLFGPLLWLSPRPPRGEAVVVALAAIAVGFVTEATIFRIALFDPVDFLNQSLGAGIAASGMIRADPSRRLAVAAVSISIVLIGAGFFFAFL